MKPTDVESVQGNHSDVINAPNAAVNPKEQADAPWMDPEHLVPTAEEEAVNSELETSMTANADDSSWTLASTNLGTDAAGIGGVSDGSGRKREFGARILRWGDR